MDNSIKLVAQKNLTIKIVYKNLKHIYCKYLHEE